jgi:hypothetical protein
VERAAGFESVQYVLVKLNPGLQWQKLHLTRTGLVLLAKWT